MIYAAMMVPRTLPRPAKIATIIACSSAGSCSVSNAGAAAADAAGAATRLRSGWLGSLAPAAARRVVDLARLLPEESSRGEAVAELERILSGSSVPAKGAPAPARSVGLRR